jgi:hypothetical protein
LTSIRRTLPQIPKETYTQRSALQVNAFYKNSGTITTVIVLSSLMRTCSDGPVVSLKGSSPVARRESKMRIEEHARNFLERDTVFPKIFAGLSGIPFKTHQPFLRGWRWKARILQLEKRTTILSVGKFCPSHFRLGKLVPLWFVAAPSARLLASPQLSVFIADRLVSGSNPVVVRGMP